MLSRKFKINLSNPYFGLLPILMLMMFDTVVGKTLAYVLGGVIALFVSVYLYFFQREKFLLWHIVSTIMFFVISFLLYDFIDDKYRFIRSEILVIIYFSMLLLLKKPLKLALLEGRNCYVLGYRENINMLFLQVKQILIFLLIYVSCYHISKTFFSSINKELYQVIEWGVLIMLFVIVSLQMYLYRLYFNDEKYVAIINENENVIGYESFRLLMGNKKFSKEKNKHIKLRVMPLYDRKLMLKCENGFWDLYFHDYLLYGENYELALKRIIGNDLPLNLKVDEKYEYTTDTEVRLTLLHTMLLDEDMVAKFDSSTYKLWTIEQLKSELFSAIFSPQLQRDLELHLPRLEDSFSPFVEDIQSN